MAEENLASEGEETHLPPEEGEQVEEQREPTASEIAAELGWKPKDQWSGDPDAWKPAAEFIKAGRDIQQTYARDVRSLREQMDRMSGVTSKLIQDKEAEINARWEARIAQAAEDGDTELAVKLAKERPAPVQAAQAGPDPTVQQWVAKNEWFNSDPLAHARATELSDRLKHLPVSEQLAQVERAIRKEFPEHFPAPAKQPPATQTANTRSAAPTNRAKGFADMPAASQAMAKDMVRRHPDLTLEAIAKSYWSDQSREGVKR